jgi:mannosyltransferase OCH1-like enzyme
MIPKIVHVAWKDKNVLNDNLPMITNGIGNIQKLNPEWLIEISNDNDIDRYLKENLTDKDFKLVKNIGIVDRCDLWRLFKIYNEGGLYIDIDRFYNISMSDVLSHNVKWLLPINGCFDFSHDVMCSEPQNPVFARTIDLNLSRRRRGIIDTYLLGAQTYMHAITEMLTGHIVDSNPGQQFFDQIKQQILNISFIKTHTEIFPHNTVVYNDPSESLNLKELKNQLYDAYQVTHWDKVI